MMLDSEVESGMPPVPNGRSKIASKRGPPLVAERQPGP